MRKRLTQKGKPLSLFMEIITYSNLVNRKDNTLFHYCMDKKLFL
ncbi:hypothetical protein QW060_12470 [Myroides ceti]|uniref:Uncharacterized protein n=1 Tax=Paenimyroides ceti TaxID=395087 RepID=A0ABT8CTU2_9FLAO|nr:hypothetical protein [Paenimyroides ceti]MDN3707923.1 hypothetical protein [Paenimyroides ceti]